MIVGTTAGERNISDTGVFDNVTSSDGTTTLRCLYVVSRSREKKNVGIRLNIASSSRAHARAPERRDRHSPPCTHLGPGSFPGTHRKTKKKKTAGSETRKAFGAIKCACFVACLCPCPLNSVQSSTHASHTRTRWRTDTKQKVPGANGSGDNVTAEC